MPTRSRPSLTARHSPLINLRSRTPNLILALFSADQVSASFAALDVSAGGGYQTTNPHSAGSAKQSACALPVK